jgi:glucokinase
MKEAKITDSNKFIIGIDVGGTNIKAVLMDKKRKIYSDLEVKTDKNNVIKQISEVIERLSKKIGKNKILGVGLGVPGVFDNKREKVIRSPNLTCLNNVKLKSIIEKKTGLKVIIENDTNCMALSKCYIIDKKVKNFVYFSIGTGVGGAVVIDRKLYAGKGNAGEFGHINVEKEGLACSCGSYGCLEEYVSKRGIERIGKSLGINGNVFEIFNLAKKGDKKAIEVFETAGKYLGIAFSDVVKVVDPDLILVGGGISNAGDLLLKPAINEMKKRTYFECCPVKKTTSDKYEGAIGAGSLFLK